MGCAFTVYGRFDGAILKAKVWEMICESMTTTRRYSGVTQTHAKWLGIEISRDAFGSHAHHSCKVY